MALDNTTHRGSDAIHIPAAIWDEVVQHLCRTLPNEGCGLLGGTRDAIGDWHVSKFYPGTNVLQSPTRYRMADAEVIRAMVAIRESGLELAAIVHSHPASPATLSRTDRNEANYPGAALIVVSFQTDTPEPSAWMVSGQDSGEVTKLCLHVFNPS